MSQIPTKVPSGPSFRARLIAFCGKQWPRYFFLGAIGFLVRLPAVQGPPIWDDVFLTRDNPFIKSPLLALEAFRHYLFLDSYRVITGRCRIFPTWSITFSGTPTQPVFILATFSCTSALACCFTGCSHCFFALTAAFGIIAIFTGSHARRTCGLPYFRPLDGAPGTFRRRWITFRDGPTASPFFFLRAHGCLSYAAEALILAG